MRSRSAARERRGRRWRGTLQEQAQADYADRRGSSRLLAFRRRREVLTSLPSVGQHCFRVAVLLSPYLGDFLAVATLTAPHPHPRCGPARLPPSPPPSPTLESPPGLLSLLDRARRATARRRRRKVGEMTQKALFRPPPTHSPVSVRPASPLRLPPFFPPARVGRSRFGPRAPGCR